MNFIVDQTEVRFFSFYFFYEFTLLILLYERQENLPLDLQLDCISLWTSLLFFGEVHLVQDEMWTLLMNAGF